MSYSRPMPTAEIDHSIDVGKEKYRPYIRLVTGVITQAVHDNQDNVKNHGLEKAMKMEPALWIFSDSYRPYGFRWCCDVVGLAPESLRSRCGDKNLIRNTREEIGARRGRTR